MSSSTFLSVYRENFYFYIGEITRNINHISVNWKLAAEISDLFRRMGISCLFIDNDIKSFFSYLNDGGNAFLFCSQKIPQQDLISSRFNPFFDALVCKNHPLAVKIAEQHPKLCNQNYEYPEEFYYYHFLMEFFLEKERDQIEQILKAYETILDGNPDIRFDLCQSLYEVNAETFEENLHSLIQLWESEQKNMQEKELLPPEIIETEGSIFLEGIALLRIAQNTGIRLDNSFSYMPQDVVDYTPGVFDSENWKWVAID